MAWNAGMLVRLHPYQYLFYNPLVGGLQGASGEYVTDYRVNIMPEAVEDLQAPLRVGDAARGGAPGAAGGLLRAGQGHFAEQHIADLLG